MLRPQKFEFDARDLMADDGCHMPNSDCSLYFDLRPPSSVLLQQSTSPRTSPLPIQLRAILQSSPRASAHRSETNTGRPTLSAFPRREARGAWRFGRSDYRSSSMFTFRCRKFYQILPTGNRPPTTAFRPPAVCAVGRLRLAVRSPACPHPPNSQMEDGSSKIGSSLSLQPVAHSLS